MGSLSQYPPVFIQVGELHTLSWSYKSYHDLHVLALGWHSGGSEENEDIYSCFMINCFLCDIFPSCNIYGMNAGAMLTNWYGVYFIYLFVLFISHFYKVIFPPGLHPDVFLII